MAKFWAHRVIIITGASSGIGKALAYLLAPQSPQLVLDYTDRPQKITDYFHQAALALIAVQ